MSKIIIVNEHDEPIGLKERGTLEPMDMYRVTALWLTNSQGDILLAQRSFSKINDPGIWGPAVAGTVEEGETYESNILKETEEEIGLTGISFTKSTYQLREGRNRHFTQWFTAVADKELAAFTIQKEEVEQIKWFSRKELTEELLNHPEKYLKGIQEFFNKTN